MIYGVPIKEQATINLILYIIINAELYIGNKSGSIQAALSVK